MSNDFVREDVKRSRKVGEVSPTGQKGLFTRSCSEFGFSRFVFVLLNRHLRYFGIYTLFTTTSVHLRAIERNDKTVICNYICMYY